MPHKLSKQQCLSILELPETATLEDVKSAYRTLALKYHPDHYKGSDTIFKDIKAAYDILINEAPTSKKVRRPPGKNDLSEVNPGQKTHFYFGEEAKQNQETLRTILVAIVGLSVGTWLILKFVRNNSSSESFNHHVLQDLARKFRKK